MPDKRNIPEGSEANRSGDILKLIRVSAAELSSGSMATIARNESFKALSFRDDPTDLENLAILPDRKIEELEFRSVLNLRHIRLFDPAHVLTIGRNAHNRCKQRIRLLGVGPI